MAMNPADTFTQIGAAISAMAALGVASYGLVDASKGLWGGISNVGFRHIETGCAPFAEAMNRALGDPSWKQLLLAHWRNGRDKEAQKALVRSVVRMGLSLPKEGAEPVRIVGIEDANVTAFVAVAQKAQSGEQLEEADIAAMGRIDALVGYRIDAAYERADQKYRNVARLCAGIVAVALALVAARFVPGVTYVQAVIAGVLAVPIAPIAKDLTSSLSAAVTAAKAVRDARR
jgi:hypothetical protein